ncbi:hypothetical protein [Salinirussus salinus]|jgi:hypothetical protein|uniref:hypothetical protein n=1 Tax=Salinirussus salinus TaxID=1198300 RepID=UPI00135C4748|nr:hypothetical protein [Salinirussus salinus]
MGASATDTGTATGASVYWLGLRVVFLLYALFVFLRLLGPAARALGLASETGAYRPETSGAILLLLAVGALFALFVGLFYATFLFVAVHGTGVVVTSSAALNDDLASLVTGQAGTVAPGTARGVVPVDPALLFPPDLAQLFYLLPPALLVYAGFARRRRGGGLVEAVVAVAVGYAAMALLTILPVVWLFNNVVADALTDAFSTAVAGVTLRASVPDPVRAHLLVGVVYPLVFGGAGALVGEAVTD